MDDVWNIYVADETWSQEAERLFTAAKKAASKLQSLQMVFDPSKYQVDIFRANKDEWMKKVQTQYEAFLDIAIDFKIEVPNDSKAAVEAVEKQISDEMVSFITAYSTKVLNVATESAIDASAEAETKRRAMIEVEIDHDKITSAYKSLSKELRKCEDWSKAESHMIEVAMIKTKEWMADFQKTKEILYNMKKTVLSANLDTDLLSASEAKVGLLDSLLHSCVATIQNEDTVRCLYSLNQARDATVSYPSFGGGKLENFHRFETKLRSALKTNMVPRAELVKKLKENLTGTPHDMIPDTLHDLERALKILRDMYGDSARLVDGFKKKLAKMGPLPYPESLIPSKVTTRVTWLLELELALKELLELAKLNQDNDCEINNNTTLRAVKKLFPLEIHKELNEYHGTATEKLPHIVDYIVKLRERNQAVLRDLDGGDADCPRANVATFPAGLDPALFDEQDDGLELYCIQEGIDYMELRRLRDL